MDASKLIEFLVSAGSTEVRRQGQHRIFSHTAYPRLISVPDLGEKKLNIDLLNDILKEAGLSGRVRKASLAPRWLKMFLSCFKRTD